MTTTPWTLPSNLMICVNANFDYVKIKDNLLLQTFIIAECRLTDLYKLPEEYEILDRFKGSTLEGLDYEPAYPYFYNTFKPTGAFKIACGDFVTDKTGTGVVHCAPGFGEEDYNLCLKYKVITMDNPPVPLDDNGRLKLLRGK
jgi:isoleucyl-tRNA synthetase